MPPPSADGASSANQPTELLDVLSEVKSRIQDKLGIVDFPMPQFILIGSQSVGKSRLVESFAGEQFNFCSGTLGSRRPTVLEFRNVGTVQESKWYWLAQDTMQWQHKPMAEVLGLVSDAHNSLGQSVSKDPIYLRIESSRCVDMQIVDLPGYRYMAMGEDGKRLQAQIEDLNRMFLYDRRNVILCVEEAGDAANCRTLAKVKEVDPSYSRTILIRNKLDKYYNDLSSDNVNQWLDGHGDLPPNLIKFALSLPHWSDGQPPPKPLADMRDAAGLEDYSRLAAIGTSKKFLDQVGFQNFARYMEMRIETMFQEALGPVMQKLRDLDNAMSQQKEELEEELEHSDPTKILSTVRAVGISFANCLTHVMEGFIRSDINRMTLDDELRDFHKYHDSLGDSNTFLQLPSPEFASLDDYIDYLHNHIQVPAFELAINGGAQFRRLMFEVETFLRFSEIGIETKKTDVLQSMGIAMNSIGWREVVVKLLNHDAHLPLQLRVKYVAERIKYFFMQQKAPIVQFMESLKGSPDEKLYSYLYSKHAVLIKSNKTIEKLVFNTFDAVVQRQLEQFVDLFKSTLHATFANPWVFLKKTTARLDEDEDGAEMLLPSLEDTKKRIPKEIQSRTGVERTVNKWIFDIPQEPHLIDDAVDKVQLLVLKVYSHIRSQVCDQVELFAESFFKLPLMRRLEEDMSKIELSQVDEEGYKARRTKVEKEMAANNHATKEIKTCLVTLENFTLKTSGLKERMRAMSSTA
eukprot:TRINITY_DN2196_c0_g1_i1.p1 TRINITY_DN2196_c0_g1~~TRINITY_DN2196_c0_g1_i1.p1  ORF type:complete len:746 (+),score=242.45 TRINITY_DN2196_c0_g1_i1:110-2347(+)